MLCPRCGHLNSSDASQCDSCYANLDSDTAIMESNEDYNSSYDLNSSEQTTNGLAAFGMLLGIGTLLTCCTAVISGPYIPGILGFIGLIMSLTGKNQIAQNPESQKGANLATMGIIFCSTGLAGSIIVIVLWLLGIMALEGLKDYLPPL